MPRARVKIRVADDRKTATIEIKPLGQPGHPVDLTLAELDQFVDRLGNARSQMVKGHPIPPFERDEPPISVAANTKCTIRASPPEGVLFGFYHPKFGPVGLTLPKEEIVSIVGFLTNRFILQPTASPEKH
ncbi:hypothetical protein [Microvirga aerophila]|uniref:hypothetical protein n=1 Tax=Microvirga aerophila TaxID=670291 RepID=UPI0013B406D2|nr:hypothetical protein [Microvirga aerophila]